MQNSICQVFFCWLCNNVSEGLFLYTILPHWQGAHISQVAQQADVALAAMDSNFDSDRDPMDLDIDYF